MNFEKKDEKEILVLAIGMFLTASLIQVINLLMIYSATDMFHSGILYLFFAAVSYIAYSREKRKEQI